jgi:hypothetical protein
VIILGENLQIVPLLLQLNVIGEKLGHAILDLACMTNKLSTALTSTHSTTIIPSVTKAEAQ